MATHRTRSKPSQAKSEARSKSRRWSHRVMEANDALDIEPDISKSRSPARIAALPKAPAERSRRCKGTVFQLVISILTFYVSRAGHSLNGSRRRILERAKVVLRAEFGHPAQSAAKARR